MLAIGGFSLCAALLALAAVAPAFRSENPPRWSTHGWVGELVTIAIVCTLAIGLGYLGAGVIDAVQTGLDYLDLGLLAGVLLVTVVIWRWWKARPRPSALEADAGLRVLVSGSREAPGSSRMAPTEQTVASRSQPLPPHRAA